MVKKHRPSGGTVCCVPGCRNNSKRDRHVSWNTFPKDIRLKSEWVRVIQRLREDGEWKPSPHHRICGAHFNTSGKKTNEDKLPTIFPVKPPPGNRKRKSSSVSKRQSAVQVLGGHCLDGEPACGSAMSVDVVKTEPGHCEMMLDGHHSDQPATEMSPLDQSRANCSLMWCPALMLKTSNADEQDRTRQCKVEDVDQHPQVNAHGTMQQQQQLQQSAVSAALAVRTTQQVHRLTAITNCSCLFSVHK